MNGRYFPFLHHNHNIENITKSLLQILLHIPQYPSKSSNSPINNFSSFRILDPQSNNLLHHFPHLHHFRHQIQTPPLHVEQNIINTQDSSFSQSPKYPPLHFHPNLPYPPPKKQSFPHPPPSPAKSPPPATFPVTTPPPATFPATLFAPPTAEYAPKMEETASNNNHHRPASRLGTRGAIGEIVEVQGGHIVRSTGRKDRHSKVCTAKGPRDRRVRLSAHTAIQFYDVQDRLGYDRPSKAVDWLIKNAKSAIDELAKLPAWNPNQNSREEEEEENNDNQIVVHGENPTCGGPGEFVSEIEAVKSFFPTSGGSGSTASFNFQSYSRSAGINSSQDLRLSLQSLEQPILIHQAQDQAHQAHHQTSEELFPAVTSTVGFHVPSFPDNNEQQHRMLAWTNSASAGGGGGGGYTGNNCHVSSGGGGGGFMFNSLSPQPTMPTLPPVMMGQGQCFLQRGPLQSSNNSSSSNNNNNNNSTSSGGGNAAIRAWMDSSGVSGVYDQQQHNYNQYFQQMMQHNQACVAGGGGIGFDFGGGGGFSGFRIPARIQGEEEHDGVSDKPSSASSDSRH